MTIKLLTFSSVVLAFLAFKPVATETFVVDTNSSSIEWVASKVGGSHNGAIKLESGNLIFNGKSLKSGVFAIDMTSISIADLKGNSNQKLLAHLKNDDFFSVDKHPSSKFEITKVTSAGTDRVNVTGNLTIKGITNAITFPATVKRAKNTVVAVAKGVKVDRTKYDIKYGSKSFIADLGDKAIANEFELNITIVAKK